jgi:hypothetical protein
MGYGALAACASGIGKSHPVPEGRETGICQEAIEMTAIVVCRSAAMPSSCMGKYRKVYVVDVDYWKAWGDWEPPQVRSGARHVRRIVWDSGPQGVGKTERSAFARALKRGQELAQEWNNAGDMATAELLIGAGGSA